MIFLRNIFKGLLLVYLLAIVVYIVMADWVSDEPLEQSIYRVAEIDMIDYNVLNIQEDSIGMSYFWGAPVRDSFATVPSRAARRKLFKQYHPYLATENIPNELIKCCDNPDMISQECARIQIERVEHARKDVNARTLENMIKECCERTYLGIAGEERVNIVMLNNHLAHHN